MGSLAEYKCQCGNQASKFYQGASHLSIECQNCQQMMLRVREHSESRHCWCKPLVLQACPDCNCGEDPDVVCQRCNSAGMIKVEGEAFDEAKPFSLIHNEAKIESPWR